MKHITSLGIIGLSSALLNPTFAATNNDHDDNPNILWLFGEDICPWMPVFGDTTVQTPNIDFLARNGVTFTHCYAACPVSSTSRSSIFTGKLAAAIGMHNHRTGRTEPLRVDLPKYVEVLPKMYKDRGYHTFNDGKDDFNWSYNWYDYWTGTYTEKKFFGKVGKGSWNDRQPGQKFFGTIELYGGKNVKKCDTPVDLDRIVVPPYYPNTIEMKKQLAHHYNQIQVTDKEIGEIMEQMKKDGVYENTIIVFLSDHGYQTMRDKQFLYDGGIHVPMIIACPGNPKLLEKFGAKANTVRQDLITSVDLNATTLAISGIKRPDYMDSQNLFDPNYKRDYVISTRDRCDFTIDRIRSVRTLRYKYIRNFMTDRPLMQPQYRDKTKAYKEIMDAWKGGVKFADAWLSDKRPAEELYDLVNDPYETHNLAEDPAYRLQLEEMRKTLKKWIKESGDKGQYPESLAQMKILYERWGDRCVNPEYDEVKKLMQKEKK